MSREINGSRRNGDMPANLDWVSRRNRPPSPNGHSPILSIVDLFCGCGGLTLGAWEGARYNGRKLDIRLAIDHCATAIKVYRDNFGSDLARIECDGVDSFFVGIRGVPSDTRETATRQFVGPLDVLLAGPPCQGHSDLNNSTRRKDPRNSIYLRAIRAVEVLRPKFVVIENVPTVRHDDGQVIRAAINWLSSMGYRTSSAIFQLSQFSVPQYRKRHVLFGSRDAEFDVSSLSLHASQPPAAGEYLQGLEDEPDVLADAFFRPCRPTAANERRIRYLFDKNIFDLPNRMRPPCHRDKAHGYVSMYGRMHWDRPAQTLTSGFGSMGQGRYVHPTRPRLITPHEAARLQGFPDFFDFSAVSSVTALRQMIANAVPPQFIARLLSHLIRAKML